MVKYIIFIALFFIGCSEQTVWGDKPFIEMEQENMRSAEHIELCERKPSSMFCKTVTSIGDIQPTKEYTIRVLKEMNSNFKYVVNFRWAYNTSIYEHLEGDCEDIASTMAYYMINDGIDTKYLHLAYRKISDTEAHLFLAVDTIDAGLLHVDYSNSGYPIEPRINFHMRMDNPGVDKWVKGNIK